MKFIFEHYADYEYLLATLQLFLAMLGMGLLLVPRDFLLELKNPRALLGGLLIQWCMAPCVALLIGHLFSLPAGIVLGLMLVAAVPGGTLTNILTHFGRGNIALSVSLTAITTVAALFMTPLLLQWMMSSHLPHDFRMPAGRIARDIVLTLLLPLLWGMWLRYRLPTLRSEWYSRWVIRLSLLMIVLMAIGAGGSGRLDPKAYGVSGIAVLVLLSLSLQFFAVVACSCLRLGRPDTLAVVVEVTFRNMSLAVAIKALLFPAQAGQLDPLGDAVLFTVLLYAGVSLFMSVIPVLANRFKTDKS